MFSATKCRSVSRGPSQPQLNDVEQNRRVQVGACDLSVLWVGLQRSQAAAAGQRPGEPDRTVAGQRAKLQDIFGRPEIRATVGAACPGLVKR